MVAVWTRVEDGELTARAAIVEVGVAGLLLVLVKPPYFLALALFPALWLIRRRDLVARYAAATATALLGAGLFVALGPGGGDYEPTTRTLADTIQYQPDVQRSRLLGDPFGFLWASTRTFFADFDDYVQEWFRQLNFFKTELPVAAAWIALGVIIVAALRLDAADYQRLRGWLRGTHVAFVVGMILVIFASSFIYFDDSTDYARINRQMYRYVLPLAPMAMVGLLPRGTWILEPLTRRLRSETAIGIATAAIGTVALFGVLTWVWLLDGAALWE